ncbi:hypothetical protein CIHG_02453 [Coccidioides immitis H538.4]|uniref:Uncharacterized protein n=2 Tax=Coccidioides immitis TaxID=5501 RepID=A0A0J8RIJ4_COCIT|nr:hypothetical protein CIRG_02787 [Coccidioides immitis RMSCC 2394]KMU84667.1 hypothetical protein CIHG_02453 [Coccidioides immitis H538.4]
MVLPGSVTLLRIVENPINDTEFVYIPHDEELCSGDSILEPVSIRTLTWRWLLRRCWAWHKEFVESMTPSKVRCSAVQASTMWISFSSPAGAGLSSVKLYFLCVNGEASQLPRPLPVLHVCAIGADLLSQADEDIADISVRLVIPCREPRAVI